MPYTNQSKPYLTEVSITSIDDSAGLYWLFDEDDIPIYIGMSRLSVKMDLLHWLTKKSPVRRYYYECTPDFEARYQLAMIMHRRDFNDLPELNKEELGLSSENSDFMDDFKSPEL